jgi:hypothetical protein
MPEQPEEFSLRPLLVRACPLPVAIVPGMRVVEVTDATVGTIVGCTEAFGIYRTSEPHALAVARWCELALLDVCPAAPLLPADVIENDRRNASATVLRELLALEQFGLTAAQTAALRELVAQLCGASPA